MLCGGSQPTTAHVLGSRLTALTQGHYTYRHDQVLNFLTNELSKVLSEQCTVYADLPGRRASNSPWVTVPFSIFIIPYRPDIVIHY